MIKEKSWNKNGCAEFFMGDHENDADVFWKTCGITFR